MSYYSLRIWILPFYWQTAKFRVVITGIYEIPVPVTCGQGFRIRILLMRIRIRCVVHIYGMVQIINIYLTHLLSAWLLEQIKKFTLRQFWFLKLWSCIHLSCYLLIVRELWSCIHPAVESEFSESEMAEFHNSLEAHIRYVGEGIPLVCMWEAVIFSQYCVSGSGSVGSICFWASRIRIRIH
jgi:hypothetical protein